MSKKSKTITLLLISILFFPLTAIFFKYDEKMKVVNNDVEITCFSGEIFDFHISWLKKGRYFSPIKLVGISKQVENPVGVLKSEKGNFIIFIGRNIIKQYSIKEGYFKTYKLSSDEVIISLCVSDINNDYNDELLIITGKRNEVFGEKLIIFSFDGKPKKVLEKYFKDMNPWKVQVSDVDGDGQKEISVGVYKESEFHPVKAKRPFVYNWDGKGISPKWRGSRLSKPFEDYIFADIDGDGLDEIVSIEILRNGKKLINSYKWKGFGFEGMVESKEYPDILSIDKIRIEGSKDNIIIKIKNREKYDWVLLHYIDKKLEVKSKAKEYVPVVNID